MADKRESETEAIHEAIQANMGHVQDAAGGTVLVAWLVIAEWMDTDGTSYLSYCRPPALSPRWARGLADDYLHGDWPAPDDPGSGGT